MTGTVFSEGRHAAEFILSEANGERSRDTLNVDGGLSAGDVLGGPIAATTDVPAHYVQYDPANGVSGSNVVAGVVIYPVVNNTGEQSKVAAITRAAEVNANMLGWKVGMTDGEKVTATAALKALGVVAR